MMDEDAKGQESVVPNAEAHPLPLEKTGKRSKTPLVLRARVKIIRKNDPIALHHLLKMLLLALEIADMTPEEAAEHQRKFFDSPWS